MTPRSGTIARRSLARLAWALVPVIAASGTGCINPRDDYTAFSARPIAQREAGLVDVALTPCQELLNQALSGLYYTSCRPALLPIPFALATHETITPSQDGAGAGLAMTFTPLKTTAMSMSETTGDPIALPQTTIDANCAYTMNIGTLTIGAEANALMRDLTATDVVLRGKYQSIDRQCAELDGNVDLITLSLEQDGDICVFLRAPSDGSLPVVTDGDYACDPSGLQPRVSAL
jgi:hypothetical protein